MAIAGKVLIFYLLAGYFSYSLHVSWLSKNYNRRNTYFVSHSSFLNTMDIDTSLSIPQWYDSLLSTENRVDVREWYDEEWRNTEGGFSGVDFCHSPSASVRILDYFILSNKNNDVEDNDNNNNFKLVGAVHFSNKCESHRGLCHGGTFCAVMDDAIGWMGFCVTGTARPWTGFTVQINTSLKKPVKIGSILKLESWVTRKESNRKYWIASHLIDHDNGDVHCYAEGLFLMSPEEAYRIESSK